MSRQVAENVSSKPITGWQWSLRLFARFRRTMVDLFVLCLRLRGVTLSVATPSSSFYASLRHLAHPRLLSEFRISYPRTEDWVNPRACLVAMAKRQIMSCRESKLGLTARSQSPSPGCSRRHLVSAVLSLLAFSRVTIFNSRKF